MSRLFRTGCAHAPNMPADERRIIASAVALGAAICVWAAGGPARAQAADASAISGSTTYASRCAACHRPDRAGAPPAFPSLVGLGDRMTATQVVALLSTGRGRMPAFPDLKGPTLDALISYVRTGKDAPGPGRQAARKP